MQSIRLHITFVLLGFVLAFSGASHAQQFEPAILGAWTLRTIDNKSASGRVANNVFEFSVDTTDPIGNFIALRDQSTDIQTNSQAADIAGIMATFHITSVKGDGFVNAGLIKRVGKIRAQIEIQKNDQGARSAIYHLGLTRPDGTVDFNAISQGAFGRSFDDTPEWELDQDVTLALARFDNSFSSEVWFYMAGQPAIVKYEWIQPSNLPIGSVTSDEFFAPAIFAFGAGGTTANSISGTAADVFLIRP